MRINKIKNTFFFRFRTNYRSIAPQFRDITRRHGQRYPPVRAEISADRRGDISRHARRYPRTGHSKNRKSTSNGRIHIRQCLCSEQETEQPHQPAHHLPCAGRPFAGGSVHAAHLRGRGLGLWRTGRAGLSALGGHHRRSGRIAAAGRPKGRAAHEQARRLLRGRTDVGLVQPLRHAAFPAEPQRAHSGRRLLRDHVRLHQTRSRTPSSSGAR